MGSELAAKKYSNIALLPTAAMVIYNRLAAYCFTIISVHKCVVPYSSLFRLHLLDRKSKTCHVNTRVVLRPYTHSNARNVLTIYSVQYISLSSLASFPGLRLRLLLLPRHTTNVSSYHRTLYSCMLPAMFVFCYQ